MGKSNELVSIVMSVYNEKKEWLIECIESIINQSYKNIEIIIIIDNPNNYKLIEIVETYCNNNSRIKMIINKKNIGLISSLNIALKYCNGEYIARMDADDISYYDRIEQQVNYLKKEKLDLCASYFTRIDENGTVIDKFETKYIKSKELEKAQQYINLLAHPSWVFKRSILKELKGYKNVPTAEDYDFTCRLILLGYKVGIIPINLLNYRVRENSITNSNSLYQRRVFNLVRDSFKDAIKFKKEYNPYEKLLKIEVSEKSKKNYQIAQYRYIRFANLKKEKKFLKSIINLILSLINSPELYVLMIRDKLYEYKVKSINEFNTGN